MKTKKCKVCKNTFIPYASLQKTCGVKCWIALDKANTEKAEKKQWKERKDAARPLKWWAKKAKLACHTYIRERDKNEPCISCSRYHSGQYHAGHFMPSGVNAALRFDEANIHKQCAPCNLFKSGNLTLYRINLVKKIGAEEVERLETYNITKKYSKEDLDEITVYYKDKLRLLKELDRG